MPGKGHRFTAKEHREAEHVKESEEKRGMSPERAERVGWATVNKNKKKSAKMASTRQPSRARSRARGTSPWSA